MTELNPYESPKILSKEAPTISSTKRTLGFLTLAVLTPLAVFVAGFIGCQAVGPVVTLVQGGRNFDDPQFPLISMIVVGCAVSFIPPIIVLVVMGRWAIIAYNREDSESTAKLKEPPGSGA